MFKSLKRSLDKEMLPLQFAREHGKEGREEGEREGWRERMCRHLSGYGGCVSMVVSLGRAADLILPRCPFPAL